MKYPPQQPTRFVIGAILFAAGWIPALRQHLDELSNQHAGKALDSYINKDLEAAAEEYHEALVWKPNDPGLLTGLGRVYVDQKKTDEAEELFRKALYFDYQHPRALKALGSLLQEKNHLPDAMYLYLRYLEVQPKDAVVCSNLGAAFHNLGDYESALTYYERAEKEDPKDPLIKKNHALALLALGRSEVARAKLKEASLLAPNDAEIHRLLGSALSASGDLEQAAKFYELALKGDPMNADGHFEFAVVLTGLNRYKEATEHSKTAADLFIAVRDTGRAAQAYWELGWDYYRMGEWENSVRMSTEALQYDPKIAAVYFNIGLALLHLGRDSEALKRYEDGIQNLSQVIDLKYYAIDDLKTALQQNPDLPGGANILAMLEKKYAAAAENVTRSAPSPSASLTI